MSWLRQHLSGVAITTGSAHLAALVALSVALCCQHSEHRVAEPMSCPMHRSADEACSMAHCPVHGGSGGNATAHGDHGTHEVESRQQGTTLPNADCQLTCTDELSPEMILGTAAVLQAHASWQTPRVGALHPQPGALSPLGQTVPVILPPPLV